MVKSFLLRFFDLSHNVKKFLMISNTNNHLIDIGSLVLLMSIFEWKIAIAYVLLGLVIAVTGGTLIGKLHLESCVEDFIRTGSSLDVVQEELHFKERIKFAWIQVVGTVKRLLHIYPLVLVLVHSFTTGYRNHGL